MNDTPGPSTTTLNDCGCCAGSTATTPAEVVNRPGLSAIAYRVGVHSQFKQTMLSELSASNRAALLALRTRDDADFSIGLLDACATALDVLTFYQERIANELYLRTATERLSILYLARLIGYELSPGVAASTLLAFTLDEAPGAPAQITIDVGVKVQSIPGPGEQAQTFETIEKIEAHAAWNALRARSRRPQRIVAGITSLYLQGTNTQLQRGDAILLVGDERVTNSLSEQWDLRILRSVEPNTDKDFTLVTWDKPLGNTPYTSPAAKNLTVYALRQRAALFGHNAPDPRVLKLPDDQVGDLLTSDKKNWKYFQIQNNLIDLDAAYSKIIAGSWLVLVTASPVRQTELYRVNHVSYPSRRDFALSAKTTLIEPDSSEHLGDQFGLRETIVFAQSEKLPLFGERQDLSQQLTLSDEPIFDAVSGDTVVLNKQVDGLVKGQLLMASGKESASGEFLREVVEIADISIEPEGNLTKLTFKSGLQNQYRIDESARNANDEFALNGNVAHATHGETILAGGASNRPGDPPEEVLGSGDAGQPYLRMPLRQGPLTYVSAPTASGAESTLRVRVNGLEWHEVPTLYGRGPRERVFITRRNDDGKTTVEFGDGVTGARLPSGQDNVRATYRKGIGRPGLVKAGQLSLLQTRPLGLKDVINPIDATGAEDPQSVADARRNAPLTVLTLDRAVSLQDYEDFARAFPGIAKALATWTWDKEERTVFLTVAGADGAPVMPESDLYKNLLAALQNAGDPFVSIRATSYRKALFRIACRIKVDLDTYLPARVQAAVEQSLRDQFSFEARAFGQPVFLSEVITVIQAVPGVLAAEIDALYRAGKPVAVNPRLLAERPVVGADGAVDGSELLTLDPGPLDALGLMT